MTPEQYAELPAAIMVRELRYTIHEKDFRPREITLVTTLLDDQRYALRDLASLFQQRWEIETHYGLLKTTMKMDVFKCKTVDGVLREMQVFALIYNMVRQVILAAAHRQHVDVHRISFVERCGGCNPPRPAIRCRSWSSILSVPTASNRRSANAGLSNTPLTTMPRRQLKKTLEGN
jgi:hypothetical protein